MKRIYYFLRAYKVDIGTAIVGIAGVTLAWKYGGTLAAQQGISFFVVIVTLLVIIYLRSRERGFVFSALTWRKDKEIWMGHGIFQLARVQNAYEITDASPGYIHSEILAWSDYKLTFDFKIANKCLGVIVRAINLANYLMLQINPDGIRPHVFINGGWTVQEASQVGLVFAEPLELDKWYRCEICCDKGTVTMRLKFKRNKVFDRAWEIPRGPLIFSYKHSEEHQTVNIPFPIILEYGSVGFRNFGDEKAYVKNVLVEKL